MVEISKEWFERRAKAEADLEIGAGFSVVNMTDDDIARMEVVAERALPQWAQDELSRLRAAIRHAEPREPVAVKALEWKLRDDGETYHAQSILGRWAYWDGHYLTPEGHGGIKTADPKDAAQADYETRILSAIEVRHV